MHDYNNNGISDKEDLIIMETDDEENISYEMIGDKVFNNFMIMVDYYKDI